MLPGFVCMALINRNVKKRLIHAPALFGARENLGLLILEVIFVNIKACNMDVNKSRASPFPICPKPSVIASGTARILSILPVVSHTSTMSVSETRPSQYFFMPLP